MTNQGEITRLLSALSRGDRSAWDQLLPLVYQELHASAHRQLLRARPGETLGTTALVNEAFLRLAGHPAVSLNDRRHFFAVAAKAMRHVIVDYARRSGAAKRGGGERPVSLDRLPIPTEERAAEFIALDEALTRLGELDERAARVVELRFFGGLSVEETADVIDISPRTVKREWQRARAWLYRELQGSNPDLIPPGSP